ncbi:MAG: type II secretion system F family protein, partial [Dermatophilaceae bacterium]
MALALALGGRGQVSGVARSLALIEHNVSRHEVAKNDLPAGERLVKPFLYGMRALSMRLSPSGTGDRLVRQLDSAGNPKPWSVEMIMGAKGAGLLIFGVLGLVFGGGFTPKGLLVAIAVAAAGFFSPDLLLYNIAVKRQEELSRGLSDALDMLTVCVEAGQGFDAALMQVARSVTGPVAGEFTRALQEIQIGKPRGEAFVSMARRNNVSELRTFVTALVQADRLGLPIGGVLREQANQMRLIRRQRAEEKAMKVPVKILFPMLL